MKFYCYKKCGRLEESAFSLSLSLSSFMLFTDSLSFFRYIFFSSKHWFCRLRSRQDRKGMSESSLRIREASEKETETTPDRHQGSQRCQQDWLRGQVRAGRLRIIIITYIESERMMISRLDAWTSSLSSVGRRRTTRPWEAVRSVVSPGGLIQSCWKTIRIPIIWKILVSMVRFQCDIIVHLKLLIRNRKASITFVRCSISRATMWRARGVRERGEQTSARPVRSGHIYESHFGRVSSAMSESGEVFLPQRGIRRADQALRHLRGRFRFAEGRHRTQQQSQPPLLRSGLPGQS